MLVTLIQAVLAVVAPAVAVFLVTQAAKLNATIDGLPGIWKQIITVAESFVFAKIGVALGIALPASLAGFDPAAAQTLVVAVVSWILHKYFGVSTQASD